MYPDMPRAREWANEFERGIKAYGISAEQIQHYKDIDWGTMLSVVLGVMEQIKHNARQGRRTLLLYFYSGHGFTEDNSTYALINSNQRGDEDGGNQCNLEDCFR